MFEQGGLIGCGEHWSDSFCITKLIEATISLFLIIFVLYESIKMRLIVGRWVLGFILWIQIFILITLTLNIFYAIFHFIPTLLDLQILFQDLYYTLLLFYVGHNVLNSEKNIRIFFYVCIVGFTCIYLAMFVTRVVTENTGKSCERLEFIIIDSFTIIVSIFLIALFAYQFKKQQQLIQTQRIRKQSVIPNFKLQEDTHKKSNSLEISSFGKTSREKQRKQAIPLLSKQKQSNPFRTMWILVIVNACCSIIMQFQSIFFMIITDDQCNIVRISDTATGIIQFFFSILGFQLGFLTTICVFRNKRKMKQFAIQDVKYIIFSFEEAQTCLVFKVTTVNYNQ